MAEIKSAWQIALEKTEKIKSDPASIKAHEKKDEGRKLASLLLNGEKTVKDLQKTIKDYSRDEEKWVREGAIDSLIANLVLPSQVVDTERLNRIKAGLGFLSGQRGRTDYIIDQIADFLKQYIENKNQVREHLLARFERSLRQKEELISKQLGAPVHLNPEQDPEFARALGDNYRQLNNQYSQALEQAKSELKRITSGG